MLRLDYLPDIPTQLLIMMTALQLNLTEMIMVMILYPQQNKSGSSSSGIIELGGDVDLFRFDLKYL